MRTAIGALLALAILAPAASAQFGEDERRRAGAALDALAQAEDAKAAEYLGSLSENTEISERLWREFLCEYYESRSFAPGHVRFWELAMSGAIGSSARMSQLGPMAAAAAAGNALSGRGSGPEAGLAALQWLQALGTRTGSQYRDIVWDTLREAATDEALRRAVPVMGRGAAGAPARAVLGMQLALSLREFLRPVPQELRELATALGLPEPAASIFIEQGLFVFDNGGALGPEHAASLASVLAAIPPNLHRISALVAGGVATAGGLATSGQIVPIEVIPMTMMTSPEEFEPRFGQPVAPVFTIRAAQNIIRAVQTVQFAQRPELGVRLAVILERAGARRDHYVRLTVPPQTYLANPEELLPSVAVPWFIDTGRTFQQALRRLRLDLEAAMDQFLLFADLMSGGGNATALCATSPAGQVSFSPAPIQRARVETGVAYANGVAIHGEAWLFEVTARGATRTYRRN